LSEEREEECEVLWTDIKEAVEDLLGYLAAAGKYYDLERVLELAEEIAEKKKRAEALKCPLPEK